VHILQQDFYKYTITEGELIADFLGKIEVIVSQLASRGDTTFNDQAVMAKILCNLSGGFDSLIPAWRMQLEVAKTLDNLTLQLLMTEGIIKNRTDASVSTTATYLAKGKKPSDQSEYTTKQRAAYKKEINEWRKTTSYWAYGETSHWGRECQATEEKKRQHQEERKRLATKASSD
jgi:hypothetical protein